eukprot:CAMPEP_0172765474 /NCGR_PEP_ID=MMETSP1074-20121228/179352_1 /TAXON_ID=2916 /ORGANISM="Ceratium fusus, Strain PA161109" /LENGTH=49 /DNA_ID=CAMNT_0013600423 /DNA_START=439 /DNA_END=588 /DNA_ORIENTATION=-
MIKTAMPVTANLGDVRHLFDAIQVRFVGNTFWKNRLLPEFGCRGKEGTD